MINHAAPDWFEVKERVGQRLTGIARIPDTVWGASGIAISVSLGTTPRAFEAVPGTVLPVRCLERHIISGGEFCLALRQKPTVSSIAVQAYWVQLEQFLRCQSAATETGLWPIQNGLDHGVAGIHHDRALELASELGVIDEYLALHAGHSDGFSPLVTGRFGKDPRFQRLLRIERNRRSADLLSDVAAAVSRVPCCETMRNCPHRCRAQIVEDDIVARLRSSIAPIVLRTRLLAGTTTISNTDAQFARE